MEYVVVVHYGLENVKAPGIRVASSLSLYEDGNSAFAAAPRPSKGCFLFGCVGFREVLLLQGRFSSPSAAASKNLTKYKKGSY